MKVLLIGSGGREHAIAWKLAQSKRISKLYCAPGNGGTLSVAENVPLSAEDLPALLTFAQMENIDFTIVGPEAPLVKGIVDLFIKNGKRIFGPSRAAAQLEGSKIFMKRMLQKAGVPTAAYHTFTDPRAALNHLGTAVYPVVIKADGLAAGKGVLVAQNEKEASAFVSSAMADKVFGASGEKIIIEKFLNGEEASYIVASDGRNFVPLASAQDHKRAFDGDAGPNTGGMGAYSPAPVVTSEVDEKIRKRIIAPLISAMQDEGAEFRGFLYAGLMIDNGEPAVLEFNARLGDPEAQPILYRYEGDLLDLLEACAAGDVSKIRLEWKNDTAVCIVAASEGYPGDYRKGFPIEGLQSCGHNSVVFHAGTKLERGTVVTAGGRVLGITAGAPTIQEARDAAYACAKKIRFQGMFYRSDIAHRAIGRAGR